LLRVDEELAEGVRSLYCGMYVKVMEKRWLLK
jgi:hypothetical protein